VSGHASKRFLTRVAEVNARKYRREHGTPAIEIRPLPSRAQFLNVIKSVFNGMAKANIGNSDYASPDEAKAAIDRCFEERNTHLQANPGRPGGKIWGKERGPNTFREGQNYKDPQHRYSAAGTAGGIRRTTTDRLVAPCGSRPPAEQPRA
jgi:hypothetical protein